MVPWPIAKKRGRGLRLFLTDGTPAGVITAEPGVSAVRAVVASRTALPDLVRRDEASRTGVYLLIGPDPEFPSQQLVYAGESDQVKTRLIKHDSEGDKDFFTRAVLIVTKDANLTKAHGRYLESKLIAGIRVAGRAKLNNVNEPDFRGLPESDLADMDRVMDEIELLLPVLGFDVFTPLSEYATVDSFYETKIGGEAAVPPVFVLQANNAKGRALERGGEFVVLAGSTALIRETEGIPPGVRDKRRLLIETNVLVPDRDPGLLRFAQDARFGSPSGAGGAIWGRACNGKIERLREDDGRSYAVWRKSQIYE